MNKDGSRLNRFTDVRTHNHRVERSRQMDGHKKRLIDIRNSSRNVRNSRLYDTDLARHTSFRMRTDAANQKRRHN